MAYEGLFHEYYFDTGGDGSCGSLFCPTYTPAVTPDPLSGETERYDARIADFRDHLETEAAAIGDETPDRERELLETVLEAT